MCLVNMEYLGASCVFEFEISIPFPTIVRLPQEASLDKQSLGSLKAQAQRKKNHRASGPGLNFEPDRDRQHSLDLKFLARSTNIL